MDNKKTRLIEMVVYYAKKVVKYPKGSEGYDPVDAVNLKFYVDKLEQHEAICSN